MTDYGLTDIVKVVVCCTGGFFGWFVATFEPAFPLAAVVVVLIVYDAWTAYQLDKRVHAMFPDKRKRDKAYFTSFAFGKVVRKTIPNRLWLIMLSYAVEAFIMHHAIPLATITAGIICFEQAWSIFENESSCRSEKESRIWRIMQRIMIDKTERHLDVDLDEYKEDNKEDKDK